MTTALAVIDMQKWMFRTADRAAKLPQLIEGVNRALIEAGQHGWPVFEVRTEWPNDPATWSLRTQRDGEPVLLTGSRDVETIDGVSFPVEREIVVKTRHSAFVWTNFEQRLKEHEVSRLLIAGCWLDGCVGLTAIDAYERNIDAVILADAVVSIDDTRGDFIRQLAEHIGDIPFIPLAAALTQAT